MCELPLPLPPQLKRHPLHHFTSTVCGQDLGKDVLDGKQVSPPVQRGSKGIEENEYRDSCDGGEEEGMYLCCVCMSCIHSVSLQL